MSIASDNLLLSSHKREERLQRLRTSSAAELKAAVERNRVVAAIAPAVDAVDECSICFDELEAPESVSAAPLVELDDAPIPETDTAHTITQLDCGHRFHSACIGQWLATKQACPLCRGTVEVPITHFCVVCSDEINNCEGGEDEAFELPCECIGAWVLHDGHCPTCRADLSIGLRRDINSDVGKRKKGASSGAHDNEVRLEAQRKREQSVRNRRCMKIATVLGVISIIVTGAAYFGGLLFITQQ